MDSNSGGFKIDKSEESGYHVWKRKIQLILAFRELERHLDDTAPPVDHCELDVWCKNASKTRASIGLTLSDEHLDQVLNATTALELWNTIKSLFQFRTLFNGLNARPIF